MMKNYDIVAKSKKKRSVSNKRNLNIKDMKVDDLLDLSFFEKCFFGKKLTIKD